MAWNAIDDQITREFAFIQQLVWSSPYRNPFPSCTKKIISDLKALNTSLRSVRHNIFSQSEAGKASKLAATAKILDSDALKLIEFRASYCKKLLQLERLLGEKYKLSDLETKVDVLLVQHIKQAWENDVEGEDIVRWMTPPAEIDFAVLDLAVSQIFESFQQENSINLDILSDLKGKERNSGARGGCFEWDELTAQGSCSPQFLFAEDDEEDETSYISYNDSTSRSSILEKSDMPELLIPEQHVKKLEEDRCWDPQLNTGRSSEKEIFNISQLWPRYVSSSQSDNSAPDLEVEMIMKSRLRIHPENKGAYLWHISFGLINHGSCQIEVNSLSFWRIEGDARSGSDVCSIRWPKGHVILLEGPSFLCYRTKFPCSQGCFDSPRVAFSWKYRKLAKKTTGQRQDGKQTSTECKSSTEKEEKNFPQGGEGGKIGGVKTPIYKRLGSLMYEWSAYSFKRRKC